MIVQVRLRAFLLWLNGLPFDGDPSEPAETPFRAAPSLA
jgi:hypothetical protein